MFRNGMTLAVTGALAAVMLLAGGARAEETSGEPQLKPQTTCPVMGGRINKDLYVDHDGKRIYVCCRGCIRPIKADFEKYEKILAERGEKPAEVCKCGKAGEHECKIGEETKAPVECAKCAGPKCVCGKKSEK